MILATTRITEILNYEKIFTGLREYVGVYHDSNGMPIGQDTNNRFVFFGSLLSCYRCTSVWVAIIVVTLAHFGKPDRFIIDIFSLNKLVIVLKEKGVI